VEREEAVEIVLKEPAWLSCDECDGDGMLISTRESCEYCEDGFVYNPDFQLACDVLGRAMPPRPVRSLLGPTGPIGPTGPSGPPGISVNFQAWNEILTAEQIKAVYDNDFIARIVDAEPGPLGPTGGCGEDSPG
jgi:hypothetical protein